MPGLGARLHQASFRWCSPERATGSTMWLTNRFAAVTSVSSVLHRRITNDASNSSVYICQRDFTGRWRD